jgi:uncharacterized membrane protein YphA (DoxX/SURF4 family)
MAGSLFHVAYVTEPEPSPDPLGFIAETLGRPGALLLLGLGVVAGLALLVGWQLYAHRWAAWRRFVDRAWSYRELVPWMLRLSFGLVLIGAGLTRVLFAPDVQVPGWPYALLTALGFLLLLGFAVRPAALVGLAAYFVGILVDARLVGMFEVAGGLAAVALLGPGRPSLDDLLRAAFPSAPGGAAATRPPGRERHEDLVPLLVRLGLGGSLLASGIADKVLIYEQGLEAVAKYQLTAIVPVDPGLWVVGAAVAESGLGIAILLGLATRLSAILAFGFLTLALFVLPDDPVVAHVGLFGSCSILVVLGAGTWSLEGLLGRGIRRSTLAATPSEAA